MCDTLCHLGTDRTVFAKSSDRAVGEVQVVETHPARPPGGTLHTQYLELPDTGAVAVLGSRPIWLWGFEHGVNEHGVAIGNERVWTTDDPAVAPPALIGMDLVRLALERARDADAALDVLATALATHGQGGVADAGTDEAYYSSFLLADRSGAWVVETSGRTWAAEPVTTGGRSISNALTIGATWTRASADVPAGSDFRADHLPTGLQTGHAAVRRAVTTAAAERAATGRDLLASLRDHGRPDTDDRPDTGDRGAVQPLPDRRADFDGTGVSVCMHIRDFEATAASMVVELPHDPAAAPRIRCCLGSPCVSLYVPAWVDLAPSLLAAPATWRGFDDLRAGVEHVTDRIGPDEGLVLARAIRATLDPIEVALDEEAHALQDAPPDARRAFTDRVDAAIRSALTEATAIVDEVRATG